MKIGIIDSDQVGIMIGEKLISNKIENDLGFKKCQTFKIETKSLGLFKDKKIDCFEMECENVYGQHYKCEGEYNKETSNLTNMICENK